MQSRLRRADVVRPTSSPSLSARIDGLERPSYGLGTVPQISRRALAPVLCTPPTGASALRLIRVTGRSLVVAICVFAMVAFFTSNSVLAADADAFSKSVVPILRARCVSCHNSIDRKGEFSLQKRDEVLDSGFVEPGKPDDSELLKVLVSHNGKKPAMPKSGGPLKAAEVAAIREWIKDGAKWPEGLTIEDAVVEDSQWWAFQPMKKPDVSAVKAAVELQIANLRLQKADFKERTKNPIDAFVLKGLAEQKLTPSQPADPRVLVRRLYFDLIGLPPTPAEVEAFVKESQQEPAGAKPSAYERLVGRLLASQHYGERWARHWLDVVKYADTCGYDKDKLRPNAWPYRDYVIKSFNDDKPYARFVQEQLAGDVLFPGTADGILGLGFIAAGPWDWIGHAEVPESKIDGKVARHTDRDEMVSNTLNTFCSVTIQCAQCHNHKFDPFTQEHYYNLQSVFAAVDKAERAYDLDPHVEKQRLELSARLKTARAALTTLNAAIQKDGGPELVSLEKQIAELQPKATPAAKRPEFGYHSGLSPKQDVEKLVQIDLGREVEISKIVLRPCHDEFNNIGAGFGFPVRFAITGGASAADAKLHDATASDVPNPGLVPYEVTLTKTTARVIRLTATKLAHRQNDYILALAELQVLDASGNNVALKSAVTSLDSIEAPDRWRKSNLTDGIWASAGDEAVIKQLAEVQKQRQAILDRITTAERTAERERLNKEIAAADSQLKALPSGKLVYAAATHFAPIASFHPTNGKPRAIHLLHRGNVTQPRAASVPGTLPILVSADETLSAAGHFSLKPDHSEGERRAALAQWITRRDHPLTWRSIVNRIWQHHFGRGLVETPNDFGRMGKLPTHPELLDWLATEFRDNGQSFKSLHKLIVTSATYQQASAHDASNSTIDSDNRFLGRMNRRRLEAEEIRDAMLAVSGKLDPKMGGPGYYLFVLERPEHSPHYEYHKFNPDDAASHRRSVYRFIVRSQPDPYMTTLDCADSSQSTPQRNETLTSLQALSLLNNGFSLTMSKHFAAKLTAEQQPVAEQVRLAFERVSGRSPTDAELTELTAYAHKHGLPNLCRVLFNLSEFVYVD